MTTYLKKERLKYPLPALKLGNCFIAGGAVRDSLVGLKPEDIDIFGPTKEDLDKFIEENLKTAKQTYNTDELKSYELDGVKIQVIYKVFGDIDGILDKFDYTICMFALDGNGTVVTTGDALVDLYEKRLIVHRLNPLFIIDSLRRMQKYIKKGFTICDGGLNSLVGAIRSATDKNIEDNFVFYPDGTKRGRRFD